MAIRPLEDIKSLCEVSGQTKKGCTMNMQFERVYRGRFLERAISLILSLLLLGGCGNSTGLSTSTKLSSGGGAAAQPAALGFLSQPSQRAGEPLKAFQVGLFDADGNPVSLDGILITVSSPEVELLETRP